MLTLGPNSLFSSSLVPWGKTERSTYLALHLVFSGVTIWILRLNALAKLVLFFAKPFLFSGGAEKGLFHLRPVLKPGGKPPREPPALRETDFQQPHQGIQTQTHPGRRGKCCGDPRRFRSSVRWSPFALACYYFTHCFPHFFKGWPSPFLLLVTWSRTKPLPTWLVVLHF